MSVTASLPRTIVGLAALGLITAGSPVAAQSIIDLNGDGVSDILLQDSSSKNVAAWLMNRDGRPAEFVSVGSGARGSWTVDFTFCNGGCFTSTDSGPWTVAGVRDLNADGVSDILLQSPSGTVAGWLMNRMGQPTSAVKVSDEFFYCYGDAWCVTDSRWRLVATADLDDDGLTDLVFESPYDPGRIGFGGPGGVRSLLLDQAGHVKSGGGYVWPYDTDTWRVVGATDANGDGIVDLLLQNSDGYVAAWIMNRIGQPVEFVFVWPYETNGWKVVGTLYLNDGGAGDVLLQHSTGLVAAWLMDQAGQPTSFVWVWPYEAGPWRVNGQ